LWLLATAKNNVLGEIVRLKLIENDSLVDK
jgi:hypothetical protein